MRANTTNRLCYWSDELTSLETVGNSECNQVCSGDATQLCGAANRAIIYQDDAWLNLSRKELALSMGQLESIMGRLRARLIQLQGLLERWEAERPPGTDVRARQEGLEPLLRAIDSVRSALDAIMRQWGTFYFIGLEFDSK